MKVGMASMECKGGKDQLEHEVQAEGDRRHKDNNEHVNTKYLAYKSHNIFKCYP